MLHPSLDDNPLSDTLQVIDFYDGSMGGGPEFERGSFVSMRV